MIVEDGTGISNANSYVARADADTYFAERAREEWAAATTAARDAALIRATQFVEHRWSTRFVGIRASSGQALSWPRVEAVNAYGFEESGVPNAVKVATMEAAVEALSASLFVVDNPSERVSRLQAGSFSVNLDATAPARRDIEAVNSAIAPVVLSVSKTLRA